ncbi:MAG: GNAT family N-acetyltransferase [Pseudomonadota bacterium]
MKLRRMSSQDVEQVVRIQKSITRQPVSDRWRGMVACHVDHDDMVGFVAEVDGKLVGFVIGEIKVGGFGSEVTGWIEMVGVNPDQMGGGVGRALAQALFDYFLAQGVPDICTAVRWDSGDMLAFFKNLGFDRSPFINLQLTRKA